ncbi:MAG: DUF4328 domain-containing protein [Acidimicrobiia bacterium]|nr:DUF4328 domain-containing protein [Acidimicrobiia bacterium]
MISRRLTPLPSGYQSMRVRAALARWGALALGVMSGAWLAALYAQVRAMGTGVDVSWAARRVDGIESAMAIVAAVTAVASLLWVRRAYLNVRPLGVRHPRFDSDWAVGGWFVPVLNAIRPKQVIDDIWRASEVDAPNPRHDDWLTGPIPGWIHLWWALVVAAAVAWSAAFLVSGPLGTTRTSQVLLMVVALAVIGAGPLFSWLVWRLTERQVSRASRLGALRGSGRIRSERPLLVTGAIATVAVIVFGAVTWPVVASETKAFPAGQRYEGYGVTFEYPSGFAITEAGVPDGAPTEEAGEVMVARHTGGDVATLRWTARTGEPLSAILEATVAEVAAPLGSSLFHGRPVSALIDGATFVVENFSVGDGVSRMAYAAVVVGPCSATDRLLTIVVIADTTREIRRSLTAMLVATARC